MIPRNIQLKNFLSYGPEPQSIDFSRYNLICLSGKNGHGKSALLDAITWAIWGQARKTSGTSKADQGLLHLGQKHMFVILEFEVNNQIYRVRREFVQTNSKPFASLDFGVMQENQKITPLTDKTIKATQEKIEKTIGITYESFINSAFLRQGQSNEFSKKTPKERKEILAQILQLQQFEEQKKIAQSQAKKLQQEHKTLLSIQQRIETELEQLLNLATLYQTIIIKLEEYDQQKKALALQKNIFDNAKNSLLQQKKELELITKQQQDLKQQLAECQKGIQEISVAWQASEQKEPLFLKKELEAQQKSLQELVTTMQEKLQKKLIFKEHYLATREELSKFTTLFEKDINTQAQSIQIELIKYQEQLFQIQQQIQQEASRITKQKHEILELEKQLAHLQDLLVKNNFDLIVYQKQEQEFEKTTFYYQSLKAQEGLLQEQLIGIEQQLESLQTKQSCCPLCTQSLSITHQHTVQVTLKEQAITIQNKLLLLKNTIAQTEQNIQSAQLLLQTTKQKHEQSINLVSKHQELLKILEKLKEQEAKNNIAELTKQEQEIIVLVSHTQKQLHELEQKKNNIAQTEQYKTLQATLTTIEIAAKELGHNPELHKKAELDLQEVTKLLTTHDPAENIAEKQAEYKATLASLTKTAQILSQQLEQIAKQIEHYTDLEPKQKQLQIDEQALLIQQKNLDLIQSELFMEKGSIEQKQRKQKDLHVELAQLLKDIHVIHQEMIDYQEIAKALGKDGIQALLIEQAIPEIEDETNEILARLTNNQTQIFIESLRDLKKGGSRETLDIKISDSFGLRDYEMFSGGEAFRIDFALRIGISKLLARRAGTTLQTIFIDEGFGSQDEEGLQLIMDNLYKIQHDFSKIIIVSHLAEMKEQFPVQFIVEKKRMGSTISIIEQG